MKNSIQKFLLTGCALLIPLARLQAAETNQPTTAEEILTTGPDLILTDPFMAPSLRPILAKSGARIVERDRKERPLAGRPGAAAVAAVRQGQDMNAEIIVGVGPHCARRPAGAASKRAERLH